MSVCLFLYPSNLLAPLTVLSLCTSPKIFQFHAANSGLAEAENFRAEEDSSAGRVTERREVEETPTFFYEDTEKIMGKQALPGEGAGLFVTGGLTAEDFKTRGKRTVITKESESERKQDDLQKFPARKFSIPKPDSPTGNVETKDSKKVPKEDKEASESNKTKTESTGILIQPVFHQKPVIETQTEGERDEVDKTRMLFTVTDCEPVDRNITQKELKLNDQFVHVDVTSETQETDSSGLSKEFKKASAKPRRDETQEEKEKLSRTAESKQQTVSAGKALRFHKDSPNKQTELVEKLSKDASDKDLNKNFDVWSNDSRVELQKDRLDALKKQTEDMEPLLLELHPTENVPLHENEQKLLEFEISLKDIQSKILGAEDKILRVPKLTKEKEQHQSKAADVAEEMQPSAAELEEIDPASESALQPAEGKGLDTFLDKTAETDAIKSESVSSAQQKKNKPAGIIVEQELLKLRPVRDQTCKTGEMNPRDLEIVNECTNFAAGGELSQESEGKEWRSLQNKKQHQSMRPKEAAEKQITPKLVSVRDKTTKVTQEKDIPAREHSKHRDVTTQTVPSEETGTAGREKTTKAQGVVVEKDQQVVVKDETAADHHLKNRDLATESSAFHKKIYSTTNESVCPQKPQQKPAKLQGIVVEQDQLKFGTVRDQTFRVPLTKETKAAERADSKVPPLFVESSRDVETTSEKLVSEGFPPTESVSGGQHKSPQTKEVTVTEIITVEEESDTAGDVTSVEERQIRTLVPSKDKTHKIAPVRVRRAREEQTKKETDTLPEVEETGDASHEKGKTLRAVKTQEITLKEDEDETNKDFSTATIKPVMERTKIVPHEYKKTRHEMKAVIKGGEKTEIQAEKDELETSNELENVQNEENQTKERQNIQNSPESELDDALSKKSKLLNERSTNVSPVETQSGVVVVKTKSGSVPLEVEQTTKLKRFLAAPVLEVTSERSRVVEKGKSNAVQSFVSPQEKVFRTDRDEPVKSKVQEVQNETWNVTGILGKFSESEKQIEGKASGRNQQEVTGQKALVEEPTTVVRSTATVTAVTDRSGTDMEEFQSKKLKSLKKKGQKLDKDTVTLEELQSEPAPVKNEFGSVHLFHATEAKEEQVERTLCVAPVKEVTSGEHSVVQQGGVKSETSLKYIIPDNLFQDITSSQEDVQVSLVHNFKSAETVVEGAEEEIAESTVKEIQQIYKHTVPKVQQGGVRPQQAEKTLAGKDAESSIDITRSSIQPDQEQRTVSIRKDKPVTQQNEKETLTGRVAEEKDIKEQGRETYQSQKIAHELNSSRKCKPSGSKADIDQQESSAREPSVTDQIEPNMAEKEAARATDARTKAAVKQPSQAGEVGRIPPQAIKTKTRGEAPGPGSVFETKVSSLDPERKERVLSQEPSRGTQGQIFCVTEHMVLILRTKHPRAPPVKHRLLDLSAPYSLSEERFHPRHSTHSVWARICLLCLDQCRLRRAGSLLNHQCDVCFMFCPLLSFMWLIVWGAC